MITNEQLDDVREVQRTLAATQDSRARERAAALSAAIETIERLPTTKDGVRVALGDQVYVAHQGEVYSAHVVPDESMERDNGCVAEAWIRVDGKTTSIRACHVSESYSTALAAKGGGDA